jgi:tryptophan 2,3-dioxygenase
METLTPQDFLAFRGKLGTASGFQSLQMREIEAIMGLQESERSAFGHSDPMTSIHAAVRHNPGAMALLDRLRAARQEVTLRQALHDWLYRTPIQGSTPGDADDAAVVQAFVHAYIAALEQQQEPQIQHLVADGGNEETIRAQFATVTRAAQAFLDAESIDEAARLRTRRIRAGLLFIESYRELPLLAWPRLLLDTVVEMEELFILWRTRHARMVERVIGRRIGTGGSSGVDYLDETARYRIFPELWAVRTLLVPRTAVPPLQRPELYHFTVEQELP